MNFIFSGLFWGMILVLLGLSVILKSIFNIDIPVFKIVVAVVLIYLGISILIGNKVKKHNDFLMFKEDEMSLNEGHREKTILFGSGRIDLSEITLYNEDYHMNVNVIFGSGIINLPEDVPARIKVSSVFGEAKLPNGSTEVFGDQTYYTKTYKKGEPCLKLNLDVVFGSGIIINK